MNIEVCDKWQLAQLTANQSLLGIMIDTVRVEQTVRRSELNMSQLRMEEQQQMDVVCRLDNAEQVVTGLVSLTNSVNGDVATLAARTKDVRLVVTNVTEVLKESLKVFTDMEAVGERAMERWHKVEAVTNVLLSESSSSSSSEDEK
jgi:hypothetical protein